MVYHWTLPPRWSPLPNYIVGPSTTTRSKYKAAPPSTLEYGRLYASYSFLPPYSDPQRASRVTLDLSSGSPHHRGHPPPLSTLNSLPDMVVLRVVPYPASRHIGRSAHFLPRSPCIAPRRSCPWGSANSLVQLHCSSGFSPLHSFLRKCTFCMSLSASYALPIT